MLIIYKLIIDIDILIIDIDNVYINNNVFN